MSKRIHDAALESMKTWALHSETGDVYTLWWLAPASAPYPAESRSFTFPTLAMPAFQARKAAVVDLVSQLKKALGDLPSGVGETPLLEAVHLISATQTEPYSLVLYSDLHEESPRSRALRRSSGTAESPTPRWMLELCPRVGQPPDEIRVYSWPGLIGSKVNVAQYTRDRSDFEAFFAEWAPRARRIFFRID
ncbi:MAG: hypothetical protein NXI30_19295 [bacterium]|nr:hypothetical protein [bacterium]